MVSIQYNDLIKKKKIVENDKSKIAAVITELDQKKNEALQNAWKKVNKVRSTCIYVCTLFLHVLLSTNIIYVLYSFVLFIGLWINIFHTSAWY